MPLNLEYTKAEYSHKKVIEKYISDAEDIGLWQSEKIVFNKFLSSKNKILDLGCGAGRATFGLHDMGYINIIGVDLSQEMIIAAVEIARNKDKNISFIGGNACELSFETNIFDAVIFSFNGIMTIPSREMRQMAFDEIYRVLKTGGIFIFTTHNINNLQFLKYWKEERVRWNRREQDSRLSEYGDLIFSKQDDYGDADSFVHVPLDGEVEGNLKNSGFNLIYSKLRSDICNESSKVLENSVDCIFWVAVKNK